jgi:FkbM family methyltransferase
MASSRVGIASNMMSRVPVQLLVPAIAWQYRWNEPELGRIDEFVPADRGAVDVGVWWGPWTWRLARRVPRVEAFEPNAELVRWLTPVMPENVELHCVALSDRTGVSDLWVPSRGMGTEGRSSLELERTQGQFTGQPVATRRMDELELGDIGFIKIDVEGHELAVLEGATKLLGSERPTVLVEVEPHQGRLGHLDRVIEFFADHSYRGDYLHRGTWHPIEGLDRQRMCDMAARVARHGYGTNLLYARSYIRNFVFKPR